LDDRAVFQGDGLPGYELAALRAGRHSQPLGSFHEKGPAAVFLEREPETTRPPVGHGEGDQLHFSRIQDDTRLEGNQVELQVDLAASQHNVDQVSHPLQRPVAGIDVQFFGCFPTGKCRHNTTKSQDVIQVSVGQQNRIEALEAQAAAQQLALCALAAVDHEAPILVKNDRRGQVAAHRGR